MFWKQYGKLITRLWLNWFGAAVFGFMLSSITTFASERLPDNATLIYVISGVLGTVFYGYLLYLLIWEAGASDRIKVDGGRLEPRPHYGIKIALVFSLPMIVFSLLYFAASILREFLSVDNGFVNAVSDIGYIPSFIFAMPYVGFDLALFGQLGKHIAEIGQTFYNAIYMVASVLPAMLVIWLGYYFGYQGKFMSRFYGPKKKPKE